MEIDKPNSANGVSSYDSTSSGSLIHFFNRNVSPYPTESGGPKFDLVPVQKHKDIMLNVARLHAKQEYDRIIELVTVLQKQAEQIKHRLDLTDMVHAAKYDFQLANGNIYWLLFDHIKQFTRLSIHGPNDWSGRAPEQYEDHTWIEVEDDK